MNKSDSLKICFIMMPFTVKDYDKAKYSDPDHWNEVYEGLILPAADAANVQCIRDDKDYGTRLIMENILKKIEDVDIILCDLSSHNPNVFLELGWALRADKPFILIKDELTSYTFDLNQYYTFSYNHTLQPTRLKKEISELKNVFTSTILDKRNRFSLIKNLEISYRAIEASKTGDINTQLLMKLEDSIKNMGLQSVPESENISFTWPYLLHKANEIMNTLIKRFQNESIRDYSLLKSELQGIAQKTESWQHPTYQFSLINNKREFVYHDKENLIGGKALYQGSEGQDMYDDIMRYDCGAVAWTDQASNTRNYYGVKKRFNFAIFKKINLNIRAVVEIHLEIR